MGINEEFLNWCESKWENEFKAQRLFSKLSNEDIDFLKDQYETRLKADMVAMLEELYMEIEELDTPSDDSYDAGIVDCEKLIQEKINSLKEAENVD